VRHAADPLYLEFLNIIRFRRPTQEEIDTAISGCLIAKRDAINAASDATTILCTHNQDVNHLNRAILHRIFPSDQIVQISLRTTAPFEDFSKKWILDEEFYTLSEVAIGAAVIVTANINLRVDASNGARGIVQSIESKDGQVEKIAVRLCGTNKLITVRVRSKTANLYNDAKHYTKHAFALCLAYAAHW
jgi:hypothetical protein